MIRAMYRRLVAALPTGALLAMVLFGTSALAAQSDPADDGGQGDAASRSVDVEEADPRGAGSDTPARDAEPADEPADETQPPAADAPGPDKPSTDVFVPTEEISEDYAVSFPVDI